MSLSMQGSGREYWENSPRMDLRDHCSREQHLATSMSFFALKLFLHFSSHAIDRPIPIPIPNFHIIISFSITITTLLHIYIHLHRNPSFTFAPPPP